MKRGVNPAQDRIYGLGQVMAHGGGKVTVRKIQPDYHWDYEIELQCGVRCWVQESQLRPWKSPLVELAEQAE